MRRTAVLLALVLVAVGCSTTHKYDPLPVPEASEGTTPTSSTIAPRLDEVQLAPVEGRTTATTTAIGPGPVTIVGRVDGPDGPVSNARVHLDRLVGDGVASVEVPTGPDGSWNVQNVLGGRYRIRAYQAPSLGMLRAQGAAPGPQRPLAQLPGLFQLVEVLQEIGEARGRTQRVGVSRA